MRYLAQKSDAKQAEMIEKAHHNKAMEVLEEKKTEWQRKKEELLYKRELLQTKKELEDAGYTETEIIGLFPDLKALYE